VIPAYGGETYPNVMIRVTQREPLGQRLLFLDSAGVILLFTYLLLIPAGPAGLVLASTALLLRIIRMNRPTFVCFLLLFGMKTFGSIFIALGLPGLGGKIVIVMTAVLLLTMYRPPKLISELKQPMLLLCWIFAVCGFFYFLGPQTAFCKGKLTWIVVSGSLYVLLFIILNRDRNVDWWLLGQAAVACAVVFLAAGVMLAPEIRPRNVFDMGCIREIADRARDKGLSLFSRNEFGYFACAGLLLMVAHRPDRRMTSRSLAALLLYFIAAIIMISWSGARTYLTALAFSSLAMLFVRPAGKWRHWSVAGVTVLGVVGILAIGARSNVRYVTAMMDTNQTATERVNRSTNWMAALARIQEKPLYGHGLGGYYIDGYSYPGSGTYAHNLILELLSEMGIVGLLLLNAPLLFFVNVRRAFGLRVRSSSGDAVFPILLLFFMRAMVSYDLSESIVLYSLIFQLSDRRGVISHIVAKARPAQRRLAGGKPAGLERV